MTVMVKISKILSDKSRGINVKSPRDYISLSRQGLTYAQLKEILAYTKISLKQMSKILSISERQLLRYSDEKILRIDVSAQLIQIVELYTQGYAVFEDEINFQLWMNGTVRALDYQKPLDLLDTPFGIQDIIKVLGRIDYGVYS